MRRRRLGETLGLFMASSSSSASVAVGTLVRYVHVCQVLGVSEFAEGPHPSPLPEGEGTRPEGEDVRFGLSADVETGKVVLRDYINATMGFEELGSRTERQPKGLMRMFSPSGNPQARNLFEVIACLQDHEGVHLEVKASGYSGGSAMSVGVAEENGDGPFGR